MPVWICLLESTYIFKLEAKLIYRFLGAFLSLLLGVFIAHIKPTFALKATKVNLFLF